MSIQHTDMEDKIHQYFGYCFRGDHQEVVRKILSGNDVAMFGSTGSDKSMCYQLPAFITGKVCMHACNTLTPSPATGRAATLTPTRILLCSI